MTWSGFLSRAMGIEGARNLTVLTTGAVDRSIEVELLFGVPVRRLDASWSRSICAFAPGQVFGFSVSGTGDVSGQGQRVFVVLCGVPGEELSSVPALRPGVHVLLSGAGKVQVPRVLSLLGRLSERGDLNAVSAERWRVLGARLMTGFAVESDAFAP